jgi:hypothetical protein
VAAVKTEPGVESNKDRYRRELEERYSASLAQLLLSPYGDPSLVGLGGAFPSQSTGQVGYSEAPAASQARRRPSGFIPVYTGAEARRSDRPSYGWNQTAWPIPSQGGSGSYSWMPGAGVGTVPASSVPVAPVPKKKKKKVPTANTPSPAPAKKKTAKTSSGKTRKSGALPTMPFPTLPAMTVPVDPVAISQAASKAVKMLPFFYSDTSTVERARTFWDAFEENTEGLPDKSRLLLFQQKLKGREAERWWNNSLIKTFRTLKTRFHNHFLSRTADELWERLHSTKRQKGESIEEWGDRVTDLCDSLDYPDARMRYQLFRRGLNNRRMLAIVDSSPARDIPEACEWLMVKDMYRPVDEDEDFEETSPAKKAAAAETPAILKPIVDQVNALAKRCDRS